MQGFTPPTLPRPPISPYQYGSFLMAEIDRIVKVYPHFRSFWENYKIGSREDMVLIRLRGTLPINYRNSHYNIPISIWFLKEFPYCGPHIYVDPTPNMSIFATNCVMENGFVNFNIFYQWFYPNNSDLIKILAILISEFGNMPPLYETPKSREQPRPPYPINTFPSVMEPTVRYPMQPRPESYNIQYQNQVQNHRVQNHQAPYTTPEWDNIYVTIQPIIYEKLSSTKKKEAEILSYSHRLKAGYSKLCSIDEALDQEQKAIDNDILRRKEMIKKVETEIKTMLEKSSTPSLDDSIIPSTPLHAQMLSSLSNDEATTDLYFHLADAVSHKVINLEEYIPVIGKIAVKQFKNRAIIQKAIENCKKDLQ